MKVPPVPNAVFKKGKVYVSRNEAIHRDAVQTAIATPRTLFGNISERSTHVIGPNDIA